MAEGKAKDARGLSIAGVLIGLLAMVVYTVYAVLHAMVFAKNNDKYY